MSWRLRCGRSLGRARHPIRLRLFPPLTVAIEGLSATQHELVNVLLDHGHSWSEVGDALSTSASAAERRYPRRDRWNAETLEQ
jgi:hypothetical protein